MNKTTMTFCSLLTLLILSITTTAQNFTVTSPSTDPYQKLCKPIKVSFAKNSLGYIHFPVTI